MLYIVQERLHDNVLLHHVQSQVLRGHEVRWRPHQGRPEHDGQIGNLHPVHVLELGHLDQVPQEEREGGSVGGRHRGQGLLDLPDLVLSAAGARGHEKPVHAVPGDQGLLQLAEEELQRARQNVDVVHALQAGQVALVDLQPDLLDVGEIPRLSVNPVGLQGLSLLDLGNALFDKQGHFTIVHQLEVTECGSENRLVLDYSLLKQVVHGWTAEEELPEFLADVAAIGRGRSSSRLVVVGQGV